MNKKSLIKQAVVILVSIFVASAFSPAWGGTISNQDQHWTSNGSATSDDYWFNDGNLHTWTVDPGVTFTIGNGTDIVGRVFVGVSGSPGHGKLEVNGGGPLILDGYPISMRIGQSGASGLFQIKDDSTVILGGRDLRYSGSAGSSINIYNGTLDLTRTGFGFDKESTATLAFGFGDAGSIIVPDASGTIASWSDFQTWAASTGDGIAADFTTSFLETADTLNFYYDALAGTTQIYTIIPEPASLFLLMLGAVGLMFRRPRR